jgi:hypothetical protein
MDYDAFLLELTERSMRLVEDGFRIKDFEISPEYDGRRMVQVFCDHPYSIVRSVVWWQ